MASSPSSKSPSTRLQNLAQILPHYVQRTNAQISHVKRQASLLYSSLKSLYRSKAPSPIRVADFLHRLLSQTPHLDTTLLTLTYTLHLLHATLLRLPFSPLSLKPISSNTPTPSPPLRLTSSLSALTALIDDFRIFLRLPALLSIYVWASSLYRTLPPDRYINAITWAQVASCALFQGLENGAYLGSKGVIDLERIWGGGLGGKRGLGGSEKGKRVTRWYLWSSRFWMGHVLLEFMRLGRVWMLQNRTTKDLPKGGGGRTSGALEAKDGDEVLAAADSTVSVSVQEDGEEARVEKKKVEYREWRRALDVNAACLPLTVHYGIEEGFLSEAQIAVLGLVPGIWGLRDAWRDTA